MAFNRSEKLFAVNKFEAPVVQRTGHVATNHEIKVRFLAGVPVFRERKRDEKDIVVIRATVR